MLNKTKTECNRPCNFQWNGNAYVCVNCGHVLTDLEMRIILEDTAITAAASNPKSAEQMIRDLKVSLAAATACIKQMCIPSGSACLLCLYSQNNGSDCVKEAVCRQYSEWEFNDLRELRKEKAHGQN